MSASFAATGKRHCLIETVVTVHENRGESA